MAEQAIQSYRDLAVWQKAISLSVACYQLTASFPKDETYGMIAQIRRSSVSVAANIAEGHGRENTGSFIQFLRVAQGSLKELETHLIIAEKVSLATSAQLEAMFAVADEIGRMVRGLIRVLQAKAGDAK